MSELIFYEFLICSKNQVKVPTCTMYLYLFCIEILTDSNQTDLDEIFCLAHLACFVGNPAWVYKSVCF